MVKIFFDDATYPTFTALKKTIRKFKKLRLTNNRKALLATFFGKYLKGNPTKKSSVKNNHFS